MKRLFTSWYKFLLALVVLSFSTFGVVHALAGNASNTRAVVMFVGDSNIALNGKYPVWDLTNGDGTILNYDHLDNNYIPVFAARSGAGIRTKDCKQNELSTCTTYDYWKLKLAGAFTKIQPDAIVTDLGINDALTQGTATTQGYMSYGKKIDWFMSLVPANTTVFWTNLPCAVEPAQYQTGCAQINYHLSLAKSRWSNLTVINWAGTANYHPEYMDSTMPVDYRVHYNDAGYSAWSKLVRNNLDAKFPAL
jgi:hypothetical protein